MAEPREQQLFPFALLEFVYHRLLRRTPLAGRIFHRLVNGFFAWLFAHDLRRLHDVLADTDLAGRYWVWGGLLLGWAREGRLLRHDLRDADFGVLTEDVPRLEAAVRALDKAGFGLVTRRLANDGRFIFFRFCRHARWHRSQFEFFVLDVVGDQLRYLLHHEQGGPEADRPVEAEYRLPAQELVPFEFLGRTWLRHADADLELTTIYGDWSTPQKDWWWWRDDRNLHSSRPWIHTDADARRLR